jgi:hypothetical protein
VDRTGAIAEFVAIAPGYGTPVRANITPQQTRQRQREPSSSFRLRIWQKNKPKRTPKTVPKLPDLEQSKSAVLNSLPSLSSQRSYDQAIREFIEWYCSDRPL